MNGPLPPPDAQAGPAAPGGPGEVLLARCVAMLAPLVRLLVAHGVGYTRLSQALKRVFMDAARAELQAEGARITDAAISLRSGVHRKEVRAAHAGAEEPAAPPRALSLAEQVFTRWQTDAAYRDAGGGPAPLPLSGPAPSFDSLVTAITRDFSRRTLLDELVRLGLVREDDGHAVPLADAVVPRRGFAEVAQYYGAHLHDHLAAGAANVRAATRGESPPFLEHSVYANGLSDASLAQLGAVARTLWKPAFNQMVETANQRYALDRERGARGRMRFGVYFYSEPDLPVGDPARSSASGSDSDPDSDPDPDPAPVSPPAAPVRAGRRRRTST
jgi:hypothetical protein